MCLDINKYLCNWSLRRRRERKGGNGGRKEMSKVPKNLNVSKNMNGKHQTIACTTPRRTHKKTAETQSAASKAEQHFQSQLKRAWNSIKRRNRGQGGTGIVLKVPRDNNQILYHETTCPKRP